MTRFAFLCPPLLSHVRAFEAIGEVLASRGHEVVFLLNAGGERFVRSSVIGVRVAGLGEPALPPTERPNGLFGILRTVREGAGRTRALVAEGPALLRGFGAEAVLADQMEPAGGLLAEHLGVPFLSVAAALPIDPDPAIPSPFLGWTYDPTRDGLKRNRGGERVARILLRRQRETLRAACRALRIPERERMEDCLSPLASLSQTVPGFDYPRGPHSRLRALGPFRPHGAEEAVELPFRRDPSRPLVFASFGTLQGHRLALFQAVAGACRAIGAQLALAHCGRLAPAEAASIDADIVTDFLPQRAVLAQADLCVCHAGLNTALDAMEHGVPVLALPIAYDQPGVAARLVHHGAGLRLSHRRADAEEIAACLSRMLADPAFRRRAGRIGAEIRAAGGARGAADLAEALLVVQTARREREPEPA